MDGFIIISRLIEDWFCCVNKMGYIGGIISRVGFMIGEVEIGVVIVLVLVKLFLKR